MHLMRTTVGLGSWFPVLIIATFNVFDTVGRFFPGLWLVSLARIYIFVFSQFLCQTKIVTLYSFVLIEAKGLVGNRLVSAALGRLLLVPLFILPFFHVFSSDAAVFTAMGVFGLTNGYLATLWWVNVMLLICFQVGNLLLCKIEPGWFAWFLKDLFSINCWCPCHLFLPNNSMTQGPSLVEPYERDAAGTIMALTLVSGLSVGACIGLLVT